MIDRKARNALAERLRHLASGSMSNNRFESLSCRSKDRVIAELEWHLALPVYDDMHEHRLSGEFALTYGQRRDFARAILFLKTEFEYEWKTKRGLRGFLNSTFRLKPLRRIPPVDTTGGDLRVWPFYHQEDYAKALKTKPYLYGGRN